MAFLRRVGLYVLVAGVFWAGAFGIAYGVVEWRGEEGPPGARGPKGLTGAAAESQERVLTQEDLCAGWPELIAEARTDIAASAILRTVQQNCD